MRRIADQTFPVCASHVARSRVSHSPGNLMHSTSHSPSGHHATADHRWPALTDRPEQIHRNLYRVAQMACGERAHNTRLDWSGGWSACANDSNRTTSGPEEYVALPGSRGWTPAWRLPTTVRATVTVRATRFPKEVLG
jgi:hypothetical protein